MSYQAFMYPNTGAVDVVTCTWCHPPLKSLLLTSCGLKTLSPAMSGSLIGMLLVVPFNLAGSVQDIRQNTYNFPCLFLAFERLSVGQDRNTQYIQLEGKDLVPDA